MLERLSIENYALIQQLELELSPSLNIITGETGAGKSILLGALGLIMGNRADTAVLKDSGRNCVIEGLFDMGGYGLETFFDENELDYERHTVIRRIVTPAGKSRAYVNDLPVQLATLRELAAHLIDIHSQNQGVLVADGEFRIRVLDSLADNRGLRAEYGRAYRALREREQELARLREEVGRNRRDEEYMRFQWQQIAALGLHEGELQELEAEQRELSNAEGILAALSEAGGLMENDETGVLAALKTAEAALQRLGGVLEGTSDLAARIHSAYVELKDVSGEVASLAGRIEDNPARLEAVDNRIGAVSDLMRRYGAASSDELLALGNDLATRLEAITDSDAEIAELEAETGALRVTAEGLAAAVTGSRTEASALFDEAVGRVLARLGMPSARFVTEITPSGALSPSGADSVRFLFNANGGEGLQSLERIASGGETSRVMLALKSIVARSTKLPTILFDEIDTGVSGKIADAMGRIIAELGDSMQVVNITHLPQVASKGETHFLVYKEASPSGNVTRIRLLDREARVGEIAKMLSGSEVTEAAVAQARALLGYGGEK
ncbi:dNA repair protein RecN [Alistipes sp. CAG:157]|nr:dNA repair protein RecN [Alistipes sp. CAG:157]